MSIFKPMMTKAEVCAALGLSVTNSHHYWWVGQIVGFMDWPRIGKTDVYTMTRVLPAFIDALSRMAHSCSILRLPDWRLNISQACYVSRNGNKGDWRTDKTLGWERLAHMFREAAKKKCHAAGLESRRIEACRKRVASFDKWLSTDRRLGQNVTSAKEWEASLALRGAVPYDDVPVLAAFLGDYMIKGPSLKRAKREAFDHEQEQVMILALVQRLDEAQRTIL
jgi:hypothetical protein